MKEQAPGAAAAAPPAVLIYPMADAKSDHDKAKCLHDRSQSFMSAWDTLEIKDKNRHQRCRRIKVGQKTL